MRSLYPHPRLECSAIFVVPAFQRTKGIPETSVPYEFERKFAHPISNVDLLSTVLHKKLEILAKLRRLRPRAHHAARG